MHQLGMRAPGGVYFLLFGMVGNNKMVDKEEAGILFLAWRVLYAEIVHARLENHRLRLQQAYKRLVGLLILRVKASGQKWYRWYSRTRGIRTERVKHFPERFRKRKLIRTTAAAVYTISPILTAEYASL
jgi:hypothetical protein